jgi:RES domain-containing protein
MLDADGLAAPFNETAYYAGEPAARFEPEKAITIEGNRWSAAGEPTIYLAGDIGVALAEFARHAPADRALEGRVWAIELRLDAAIDLRREDVRSRLGVADDPRWYLDRERCRSLGSRLRSRGNCDGLVVPSVAMLDQVSRWNAVVFVDRLRGQASVACKPLRTVVDIAPTEYSTLSQERT